MRRPAFVALLLLVSGCFQTVRPDWTAPAAAARLSGAVEVVVVDSRDREHGGGSRHIGYEHFVFSPPKRIVLKSRAHLRELVRTMMVQAGAAAGVRMMSEGTKPATSRLVVDVRELWCGGATEIPTTTISLGITIVDPATGAERVPPFSLYLSKRAWAFFLIESCDGLVPRVVSALVRDAAAVFVNRDIHTALVGLEEPSSEGRSTQAAP